MARISTSIYVTNFPESLSAKELFQSCKVYGHVVDSFIPTKRAKNGKRFGFVWFINVFNVERLVSKLCTVWIDRHKLHANIARFQRDLASGSNVGVKMAGGFRDKKTNVFSSEKENVKATNVNGGGGEFLLLDDTCEVTHDLDSYIMGELKQFSSINNVRVLLANEGFNILNVAYLGGLWVMIELDSANTKSKLLQHVGVASWFNQLCNAQGDFVSRERVVWVDIEGVPLHAWSCNTFKKIGSKWEEMLDLEESKDALFARKRICIGTKQENNILEKFKIIIHGKVFVAGGKADNNANSDDESDVEGIYDTVFGDQDDNTTNAHVHEQIGQNAEGSYDPFNIYDLLRNKDDGVTPFEMNTSFTHPPGFTPEKDKNNSNKKEQIQKDTECSHNRSEGLSSRILVDEQQDDQPTMENNNIGLVNNKKAISEKRMLWNYISLLLSRWAGECVVIGDFNEVRTESERFGSVFNAQGASAFNDFISNSGLFDVLLEGYSFTWSHPSANKMSKLDRFLVSDGFISLFPHTSAICLDKHLSDHRPILLRELNSDFGASPFRFFHSWLGWSGFDQMVIQSWNSFVFDGSNSMVRFKKKLQLLKKDIREWVSVYKRSQSGQISCIKNHICDIDQLIDKGGCTDDILLTRKDLMKQLHELK
nr:RNA-directed DNA polymerase, eukaryota [Tanacetum cinerariifolium]